MSFAGGQQGRTRRGQRGAAAVEFAIVLPLLFVILFGIVEFSIIMYDKALVTSASREGARFAAVFRPNPRPSCDEIDAEAIQSYEQGLIAFSGTKTIGHSCFRDGVAVTGAADSVCSAMGEAVSIRTDFTYAFLVIPNFVVDLTGPLTLSSTTIMRCE